MSGAKEGGGRRSRGERARARFLDAGLGVFNELVLAELLAEIGPSRVAQQLGDVSVGAFHHHFAKQADYIAALAAHGLAPATDEVAPETAELLFEIVRLPDTEVVGHLERICAREFDRLRTDGRDGFRFRLCLWAKADEPAVWRELDAALVRQDAALGAAYEVILERWGREFRPPFTVESAKVVFSALMEGLMLRHLVRPGDADAALFARTALALLPAMTRPMGDEKEFDRAMAPMARFTKGPRSGGLDPEHRKRLLDETVARADAGTYGDATLEELAAAADTSLDAIYAQFNGKAGVATAAFARFLPLLERPLRADMDKGMTARDVVARHLARIADVVARHRALTAAVVEAIQSAVHRYGSRIGPTDPRAVVPLAGILQPAIEAGQAAGDLQKDDDAELLATMVTELMLARIMARPDEEPQSVATAVAHFAFFGMRASGGSASG